MMVSNLVGVVGGDEDSPPDIADVLLSLRIYRRMTRRVLAQKTGISAQTIEEVEQGLRPVSRTFLRLMLEALDSNPVAHSEYADLAFEPDTVKQRLSAAETSSPQVHDLAELHALDCPAALMTPADCNLLATNEQFDRALPGASEHGNLIKWLLLDERARRVLPEPYWTRETHQLVGTLHCLWPTFVPRPRLGVLLSDLVDAPEFQRFWFTPTETVEDPSNSIQLRDFKTGDVAEHYRQTSQPEPPQPRTWRLFKLTPKLPDRGGSPQQELFHLDD